MDDTIRLAAQTTIDAIDKEITRLSSAREALVDLFGLGVRITPETPNTAPNPPKTVATPILQPEPPPEPVLSGNLGYTTVYESCQNDRERGRTPAMLARWEELRKQALIELDDNGGDMKRSTLRAKVGIAVRQVPHVFEHEWFKQSMGRVLLTTAGRVELDRQKIGVNSGQ